MVDSKKVKLAIVSEYPKWKAENDLSMLDPATVASDKLQEAMKPQKTESADMGLRLQRAQDAASKYCEYQVSKQDINNPSSRIKQCTENRTKMIMNCEDVKMQYLNKSPEEAEQRCLEQAKINIPTESMEKAASEYCEYTIDEGSGKEVAQCTVKTAQELADCEDWRTGRGDKNAKEICLKTHAQILKPNIKEQKAAAEFCKETSDDTPKCLKDEAKEIAVCRDKAINAEMHSQETADDKCIGESNKKAQEIKKLNQQLKEEKKQLKKTPRSIGIPGQILGA